MIDVQNAPAKQLSRRAQRNQTFYKFLDAWSLSPEDAYAKLTDSNGELLTYLENEETKHGELLYQRASFQQRLNERRALVTPNVCLALPLSGGLLVATKIERY